jgi:hypothetical protein
MGRDVVPRGAAARRALSRRPGKNMGDNRMSQIFLPARLTCPTSHATILAVSK